MGADGAGEVAVVGAGVGGLTLAIALSRRGVPVTVYERQPELREVGAAVGLSANGLRILDELGLLPALEESGTEPTELVHRHWATAAALHRIPAARDGRYRARFGAPWLGIHRAAFQRVLASACPDGVLRLGCPVERVTDRGDRVELELGDGSRHEAAVVVGADGVHSRTRAVVDPAAVPVYAGSSGFRGLVAVDDLAHMPDPGAFNLWMGPGVHVVQYPIGRDAEMLNFLVVVDEPTTWDGPLAPLPAAAGALDALLDGWHPAVREMVASVAQGERWPLLTLPPMRRWSSGRVVLLGDAAHSMVPHLGQGANQTVEDAAVLVDCLAGEPDALAAIARYERARRTRTRQVQWASRLMAPWLHLPDGPDADHRDRVDLPDVERNQLWIHGHDARADLTDPAAAR